jgi:SecD/SecF fusion protein
MRSFFWKFVIILVPNILAGLITYAAVSKYLSGDPGGFKLGVDLVGGTILVYEIDLRKVQTADSTGQTFDPARDVNVLADALKKRIDPNDLFNIIIRPAGGEGRVEIILPTGGVHRTEKANEEWKKLLIKVCDEYKIPADKRPEVGRGRIQELADKIQLLKSENLWSEKLFNNKEAWERLIGTDPKAKGAADEKQPDGPKSALAKYGNDLYTPEVFKHLQTIKVGDLEGFFNYVWSVLSKSETKHDENSLKNLIKQHAWHQLLVQVLKQWPELNAFRDEMNRIQPDSIEQLSSFIQSRGNIIGQAGLTILANALGADPLAGAEGYPEAAAVKEFINDRYGYSQSQIVKDIQKAMGGGRQRDLNVEEVQRIKDLVAKVGLLEFRILANSKDDAKGIEAASSLLNNESPLLKEELLKLSEQGLPPPGPRNQDGKPESFQVDLPRNNKSLLTYSWVECGPQERKQLGLNNDAQFDPKRNYNWKSAPGTEGVFQIADPRGPNFGKSLQGALFYKRPCKDRNLPSEERESKKWEYFVLTRDPEILDDATGLREDAITGKYLVNANSGQGSDLGPAVHFAFDTAGGNLFRKITGKNVPSGEGPNEVKRHLAIILDGQVMSAPTINTEIGGQGQISGNFTRKEVDSLVNILRAGRLPATLKPQPVSENTMAPTLGADTIKAGVYSVLVAFGAVIIFMIIYYRFAGLVASLALMSNLLLTIGFMTAVQATFTLPGLAGIVLMLGMAVDANVLIYERLREERERGANLASAIRNGYERALPTIIDTHLSSIFTAIVLYLVGNDQLKGFGVSLTVGLIISLFTSLYMTRAIFDFGLAKGWVKKLSMLRMFARPNIDFMGIRKPMFIVTVALALLGFALFFGRAPFNIDFVGGTAFGSQLTKAVDVAELRGYLDDKRIKKMLDVALVVEEEDPVATRPATGENKDDPKNPEKKLNLGTGRFLVTYKDGEKRSVSLVNPPDAPSKEDRALLVKERLQALPDITVEQLFPSNEEHPPGKTPHFSVRTAEKEPEIVQASLDRLLRDDQGKTLLKRIYVATEPFKGREAKLKFFEQAPAKDADLAKEPGTAFASPIFVKSFFTRELLKAYQLDDKKKLPPFEILGDGASSADGRFKVMRIKFEKAPEKDDMAKIALALQRTVEHFNDAIQPDRLENFDPQLASENRNRALMAILASWVAILVYLWFRFGNWTFGLAAVICLVHDLFITLGFIAAAHYFHDTWWGQLLKLEDFKVDLPAIAALLTLVGYSVNDTIVVFDRIKEVRGKNPDLTAKIINDSVNQTLSRTLLASFTTWLVVAVLFWFGGPGVHLFAFVMVIGVIVGTYSSIYIASPLLLMFGEGTVSQQNQGQNRPKVSPEPAAV